MNLFSRSINCLLPKNVISVVEKISETQGELYPEEAHFVRKAIDKRVREFTSGRTCARSVLNKLGYPKCMLLVGVKREPLWPNDIIGSISHDGEYCIAAAARRKDCSLLGIDVAIASPLDDNLIRYICSEEEVHKIVHSNSFDVGVDPYKLVFSIKESVFKCLFPRVLTVFGFLDVAVSFEPNTNCAKISLLNDKVFSDTELTINSKFCIRNDYIFSASWVL